MDKLAKFISVITHPALLPTWMLLVFINSGIFKISFLRADISLAIVFVTTFVIPILILFVLKKLKLIKSLTMERREERFIPIFIMVLFLYSTSRFFTGVIALALYNFYLIANLVLCVLVFWINMYWKISFHSCGWGAFTAMLFIMSTIASNIYLSYFIASILISGLVGWARLKLKSHSESQLYVGFTVGFLIPILIYYFIG
ncbi:MAG: hypothetical protein IKW51_04185 [Bacteroidales bacterium]|nr:hypothetical protein [Bacteroidales bacterium]